MAGRGITVNPPPKAAAPVEPKGLQARAEGIWQKQKAAAENTAQRLASSANAVTARPAPPSVFAAQGGNARKRAASGSSDGPNLWEGLI